MKQVRDSDILSLHMSDSTILGNQVHWVDVSLISPNPYQPRIEFNDDTITELADSIKQYGILQPLTVTQVSEITPDGDTSLRYELIAGERRLRASKAAGLQKVPVIIRVGDTNKERLELAIIENLQREDLNAVDRAKAFLQLAQEFTLSHTEIGKRMGKSREYVSNTLRLLALPQYILDGLVVKKISEGHTRPLLMLQDKPDAQKNLYHDIVNYKMSVRAAEARARKEAQEKVRKEHLKIDPKLLNLEEKLSNSLKARVAIETAQDGNSGRLVINYFNPDELNDLIRMMGRVTGDTSIEALEFTPKTNVLSEEKKIQTDSGFALNTGFLDDVLVDDDKGEILAQEEKGASDPVRFGFNTETAVATHAPETIAEALTEAHDPQVLAESAMAGEPARTAIEVAPTELSPVTMKQSAAVKPAVHANDNDGFVSLSDLLARVKDAENPLDSGSLEAYERENDATMDGDEEENVAMPVQEFESQSETTTISDAELERKFTPTAAANTTSPDLYSALFNL